ncbi:amidohydrolase family protein [Bradyrhizobium sp. RDI18]|uniref:N-acyl-D-amino-acid deacylase family protein n=1 Tax=Bradyrhizobium sp. RDI18 TaxID=3367400 RepID=UPI003710A3BC
MKCLPVLLAAVSIAGLIAHGGYAFAAETADLVISGGTIYSGADEAPFVGDVAVTGDRIVYVGPRAGAPAAKTTIDAQGMIVAPGLIDVHTHPESYIRSGDAAKRLNAPWLMQGVSTVFIGVDGRGTPNVAADQAELEAQKVGTNIVSYVGFGAVREAVLGKDARAPSPAELDRMKALVAKAMCEGAIGLSAGLFYAPQSFAKTEEVVAVAKEAARRGGIYDTHQRDESSYSIGLMNSVREVLQIGREAEMPVHFAHLKALGVDLQGQVPEVIRLIEAARASGQKVTADQYPWLASSTSLDAALVPRWAVDGGYEAMIRRFDDAAAMAKIRGEMIENLRRRGGADSILLVSVDRPWTGKRLSEMADTWRIEPIDAAVRILRANPRDMIASFNMIDSDVDLVMKQPWVVTSSDGNDGHPRQYATFPQKYAVYVRERGVIDLRTFIRQSTGLSADIFKLDRRGYLRPDYFADVVVFDPARYAPKADYVRPSELSAGVQTLLVNGTPAIQDGKLTPAASGRALKRTPAPGTCP